MKLTILGDKRYQQRARKALPLLVRQAKAGQPVTYGAFAAELGMPNPRNLNHVLGAIGNAVSDLSAQWGIQVPPIQILVHNKGTGIPGKGVHPLIAHLKGFAGLTPREKRLAFEEMRKSVYSFPLWDEVLEAFKLEPAPPPVPPSSLANVPTPHGGVESPQHKRLKAYVAANPGILAVPGTVQRVITEHKLPSGDAIDVLVEYKARSIAVEVKAETAPQLEVLRGLFQCVKYRALLRAVAAVESPDRDADAVLVLGATLPANLIPLRNTLGIVVYESVSPDN